MAAMDGNHPFDPAYGIMKSLQQEVSELRHALEAEQRQRAAEVGELQREVANLKKAFAVEQSERISSYERLSCGLTSETALRGKAIEKVRGEHAETAQRLAETCQLQTVHDRLIAKLSMNLDVEIKERKFGQKDLDARLVEEINQRESHYNYLAKSLDDFREQTEANITYDRDRMASLTKSVQLAGQFLGVGSPSKDVVADHLGATGFSDMSTAIGSPIPEAHPADADASNPASPAAVQQ